MRAAKAKRALLSDSLNSSGQESALVAIEWLHM
jgi:hypothetical protein